MFNDTGVLMLLGIGLAYLAAPFVMLGFGLWLLLRRPRRRWMGAGLIAVVLLWCFGPWALGQARLQLARAPVAALQHPPGDLLVRGARIVMVVMHGETDCTRLCRELLDSGLVNEIHLIEAHRELDFDRIANDPLGALVDDRATHWRITLGAPLVDFGGHRPSQAEFLPETGRPAADLVILYDPGGALGTLAWDVLIPDQANPAIGHRGVRLDQALFIWRRWPASGTLQTVAARLVEFEVMLPEVLIWPFITDRQTLPAPSIIPILQDWLCRSGDQRRDLCAGPS